MATKALWVPPEAREKLTKIVDGLREVADMVDGCRQPDLADDIHAACNEIQKIAKGNTR